MTHKKFVLQVFSPVVSSALKIQHFEFTILTLRDTKIVAVTKLYFLKKRESTFITEVNFG